MPLLAFGGLHCRLGVSDRACTTESDVLRRGKHLLHPDFEQVLRAQARFLAAGTRIDPDLSMASLGVDSLDIIELIVILEGKFDLEIPIDQVTPETFSTPGSIWRLLCELDPELAASESSLR